MNPLVRYLETGEPCEMLGMIRCGDRLVFCVRAPDGTIIGCGGREIERWSADVVPLVRSASPRLSALRTAGEITPVSPANPSQETM